MGIDKRGCLAWVSSPQHISFTSYASAKSGKFNIRALFSGTGLNNRKSHQFQCTSIILECCDFIRACPRHFWVLLILKDVFEVFIRVSWFPFCGALLGSSLIMFINLSIAAGFCSSAGFLTALKHIMETKWTWACDLLARFAAGSLFYLQSPWDWYIIQGTRSPRCLRCCLRECAVRNYCRLGCVLATAVRALRAVKNVKLETLWRTTVRRRRVQLPHSCDLSPLSLLWWFYFWNAPIDLGMKEDEPSHDISMATALGGGGGKSTPNKLWKKIKGQLCLFFFIY